MRIDVMVDIETLGKADNTAIFQIYAEAFNRDTFETIDTLELKININTIKPELMDMDTLYWWTQNHGELFKKLTETTDEHTGEYHAAYQLARWFENLRFAYASGDNDIYLWGNGSMFDNIKIKNLLTRNGEKYPIYYRNDRDLRTLIDCASRNSGLSEENIKELVTIGSEVQHDAKDDVAFQIRLLKKCYGLIAHGSAHKSRELTKLFYLYNNRVVVIGDILIHLEGVKLVDVETGSTSFVKYEQFLRTAVVVNIIDKLEEI